MNECIDEFLNTSRGINHQSGLMHLVDSLAFCGELLPPLVCSRLRFYTLNQMKSYNRYTIYKVLCIYNYCIFSHATDHSFTCMIDKSS